MIDPEASGKDRGNLVSPLFDSAWYEAHYPDVASSSMTAWGHYCLYGVDEGRKPNVHLDPPWYLDSYPELRSSNVDPVEHFLLEGWKDGRDPGPSFSTDWYLEEHPDVAEAGINPLLHFLEIGRDLGYSPLPHWSDEVVDQDEDEAAHIGLTGSDIPGGVSPGGTRLSYSRQTGAAAHRQEPDRLTIRFFTAVFDDTWYRQKYEGVMPEMLSSDISNESEHYWTLGAQRQLSPSPYFDVATFQNRASTAIQRDATRQDRTLIEQYVRSAELHAYSPCPLFDEAYFRASLDATRLQWLQRDMETGVVVSGLHFYLKHRLDPDLAPHPLVNYRINDLMGDQRISWEKALYLDDDVAFVSPVFDIAWYRARYPEVLAYVGPDKTFNNPLHHFLALGVPEDKSPCPDFDSEYYRRHVPGLDQELEAGQMLSPVHHWIMHGLRDNFSPNKFFDARYYLERNPMARREIDEFGLLGAFEHFLLLGRDRGYKCNRPLIDVPIDEEQTKNAFYRKARVVADYSKALPAAPDSGVEGLSVVIPAKNHAEFTASLLTHIGYSREFIGAQVIVCDDGSTDETSMLDRWFPAVTLIKNERTRGYSGAVNSGILAADGDYILLLNNDIEVLPGAATAALQLMAADDNIGAVGGPVIRTHGLLQEAGSQVLGDGSCRGVGRGDDPLLPHHSSTRDVDFCSAAFILLRRSALDRVGLLDEHRFSPGYYEEVDLCVRLWADGFRVVYCPEAAVIHHEFASFSSGRPQAASFALQLEHRAAFIAKQSEFVRASGKASEGLPIVRNGSRRALVIDDKLPLASLGSGFGRTNEIVGMLAKRGYSIDFFMTNSVETLPRDEIRRTLPPFRSFSRRETSVHKLLATNDYDLIWASRPHNASQLARETGEALLEGIDVVFDTEGLGTNRLLELGRLRGIAATETGLDARLRDELTGSRVAAAIVVVNEREADQVRAVEPSKPVHVLSHVQECRVDTVTADSLNAKSDLLFFGAFHAYASPNYDSMSWFASEVFPLLRERLPEVQLDICGYWPEDVSPGREFETPGINLLGRIPALWDAAKFRRVFVAPTRYAAGIPIKVIEAMSYGIPVACSQLLADQLEVTHGREVLAAPATEPQRMADNIVELHENLELAATLANRSLGVVRERFSQARFSDDLDHVLASLAKPR